MRGACAECAALVSCIHQGARAAQAAGGREEVDAAAALQMYKHSLILFHCQLRTLNAAADSLLPAWVSAPAAVE